MESTIKPAPGATHTYVLRSGDVHNLEHVAHLVFGKLVQRAAPEIEAFHSDLFWDAQWLREHLATPGLESLSFNYSYDESGTHIGTSEVIIGARANSLRVRVYLDVAKLAANMEITEVGTKPVT